MKAVIILMIVGASSAQYLYGNNPLWNAGAVHHDPLWNARPAPLHAGYYLQDTPEVQAAKLQHFAAHAEARARGKRSANPGFLAAPVAYSSPIAYSHSTVVAHRPAIAYTAAAPVVHTVAHRPAVATYAAAPIAHTYAAAPIAHTYAAAPIVHSSPLLHHGARLLI